MPRIAAVHEPYRRRGRLRITVNARILEGNENSRNEEDFANNVASCLIFLGSFRKRLPCTLSDGKLTCYRSSVGGNPGPRTTKAQHQKKKAPMLPTTPTIHAREPGRFSFTKRWTNPRQRGDIRGALEEDKAISIRGESPTWNGLFSSRLKLA